jgi:ParB family transcriptional regulator, chromosome partitioning protein
MTTRKGLGKGLAALISEADALPQAGANVTDVAVERIDPNPFQPRQVFDDASIEELKQSILAQGILQPILVRKTGERYQIIVGERRWRAARAAGLTVIPALVREAATDEEMLELALLENVQREDLNPIELANALLKLQTTCNLTQDVIAEKLGKSRVHVTNTLRLLKLPPRVQAALAEGKITAGHARALLAVTDEKRLDLLFESFLTGGDTSVRDAEKLSRRAQTKGRRLERELDHRQQLEIEKMEDRLRRALATKVKIKVKQNGGVLMIRFFTPADLQRILDILER